MGAKVIVVVASVVAILAFMYFVPIIYVPMAPLNTCSNDMCTVPGAYYTSISYRLIGQGAWYWPEPPGTYELINTPFGSFG